MSKKTQKILIIISVLVVIVSIAAFLLIRNITNNHEIIDTKVHDLMEANREYFADLNSIDTSVKVHCEYNIVGSNETDSAIINLMANTQKNYLQNSAMVQSVQETTSNGTTSTETETIYIMNEKGTTTTYSQKVLNSIDNGWRTNAVSQQIHQIAQAEDFYFIESYETVLELVKEPVEINGVKYYKAVGTITDIKNIANHYNVSKWLGFYRDDIESYAFVTLFFREDNDVLYSVKYDFTNYWKDEFSVLEPNKDRTLSGELSVEIVFNDFNTVDEIVVDDKIKENAVPPLKNPIKEPIDLNNELYLMEIGPHPIKIGTKLSQYMDVFKLEPLIDSETAKYNNDGILLIEAGEAFLCNATIPDKGTVIIGGINNTTDTIVYTDCILNKINISKDSDLFSEFLLGTKLTHENSVKEFREILGAYNMYEQSNQLAFICWRSYVDYTDIEIEVDLDTGSIVDISVFCFNVEKYLQKDMK